MSNEELNENQEETQEESQEETQEETQETQEESNELSKEEFEKMQKELKTLKAQKEHWRKKADSSKEEDKSAYITREEAVLISKGYTEDVIAEAQDLAKAKGIGLSEAMELPLIKTYVNEQKAQEKAKKAQLGASGGSGGDQPEFRPGMTEEEHREAWKKYQK